MRDESPDRGDERAAALAALDRYRQADGVTDSGIGCLLDGARRLERGDGRERRREALLERASASGMAHDFAEQIYETARQEGVEPAFAFELVRCGIGVLELDQLVYEDAGDDDAMTMAAPPEELIAGAAPRPLAAERERRLRLSFRRLRRHVESSRTPEEALVSFTAEPDVGRCTY